MNTEIAKGIKPREQCSHPKAFCLMRYKCQTCGAIELVWNSRDGATPFIIGCRNCDSVSNHVDWGNDVYFPNYEPVIGMRIFIDLTQKAAEKSIRERVAEFWKDEDFKENFKNKEEAVQDFMADYYDEGEPDLVIVTQEVIDELASKIEGSQEKEEKTEKEG